MRRDNYPHWFGLFLLLGLALAAILAGGCNGSGDVTTPNTANPGVSGAIQFSAPSFTVTEGTTETEATVTVVRSASHSDVEVQFTTRNGTALAGSDYESTTGTLLFAAGVTTEFFTVPILPDQILEGTESFTIELSNPTNGAVLGAQSTTTVFIVDAAGVSSDNLLGLTDNNRLVRFASGSPGTITSTVTLSGLAPGEQAVAIDFRPATGSLYAITASGRLYTVSLTSGAALAVNAGLPVIPLNGQFFGADFDPTVDRLRIVSSTGQNFSVNPDTAMTTAEGNLFYVASDANTGRTPVVVGAAYAGATLFD
ncbi:MAG: DUF4394 domain-containing protein, partial [Candidatus Eremiobacterota bacterium]